jgi:hypothetical protein
MHALHLRPSPESYKCHLCLHAFGWDMVIWFIPCCKERLGNGGFIQDGDVSSQTSGTVWQEASCQW